LGVRLLLGAILGVLIQGLDLLQQVLLPGPLSLEPMAVAAVLAGQLFGPAGAVGNAIGGAVYTQVEMGRLLSVAAPLADLLLGCFAWAVLRWAPGASLRIETLRAYGIFLGVAVVGAAGHSAILVRTVFPTGGLASMGLWWAGALSSLILLVPPLAAPLARAAGRWVDPGTAPGEGVPRGRQLLPPVAALAGLALLLSWLGPAAPTAVSWLAILLIGPVLWAALEGGLAGGVILGSLTGYCYLLVREPAFTEPAAWHAEVVGRQAAILGFSLFGAIVGQGRQREVALRRELEEANSRLRGSLESVVRALRSALQAKDAYTEGHVGRVSAFACATGRRLGMGERDIELLEVASLLHDVGKIGIPEAILHKPGPLTEEEIRVMREHPRIGAQMLQDLEWLEAAAPLVLHHQERYDGRTDGRFPGYPEGLKGEEIPLGARIVAVVDAFDAMTSDRSYRSALSTEEAIEVLERETGRQFDPGVVEAFLAVLGESPW